MNKRILFIVDNNFFLKKYNGTHLPVLSIIKHLESLQNVEFEICYENEGQINGALRLSCRENKLAALSRGYLPSTLLLKNTYESNYDVIVCMTERYINVANSLRDHRKTKTVLIANEPYWTVPFNKVLNRPFLIYQYFVLIMVYMLENIYLRKVDHIFVQSEFEMKRYKYMINRSILRKLLIHTNV